MSGTQETIVGTCQSTEQKPGSEWVRFLIEVQGNKYPVRADTRDPDIIAAGRGVGAEVATWTLNVVESDKVNPRNNKPYINRYLEAVELGGTPGQGAAAAGGGQYTQADIDRFDEKDRRDFRSRAWAQTISAFHHTVKTDEDPILVFNRLKPFQKLLYEDIVQGLAEEPKAPELSQNDDSEIPF